MDVFAHVEDLLKTALEAMKSEGALPADLSLEGVEAEAPRDPTHGDIASNAALVLSKRAKMKPRDIAQALATRLEAFEGVAKVEVAGPGFLNLTFDIGIWHDQVRTILACGEKFGRLDVGAGQTVNLEYVSANPTGPMHVGHCRGAVFGDALANLLAFAGYDVTREYYINDAGGQIDVLGRSALLRYREALGEAIGEIPEGLYPGDYLKPVGQALAKTHGEALLALDEADWMPVVADAAMDHMMVLIKQDLAALNIHHDVFFSERSLLESEKNQIDAAITKLREKGLMYEGVLEKPKGHDDGEWESRTQTLFRSTDFGDDADRALVKSDGSYTYFAGDIAYHYNKLQRGFDQLINVFGADHVGYIPRMKAAVAALSDRNIVFDIKVCQLVRLLRAGEVVRMGKRSGNFITLRDVVDEVGRDPVRFMMLYRKNDASLDFDFAKVTEQSKDNPVFYVQYAHARVASVFRNVGETFPDLADRETAIASPDLSLLQDPGELDLIKRLAGFGKLITGAARAHEPHRVAFYLYELASALHQQWARGNDSPHLRFIQQDDQQTTAARLALIAATQQVISSGLGVLGVEAPEVMR
ncbi:MAG: arginine--tRNA ligase [Hyphomicrobiaceae bacterium]